MTKNVLARAALLAALLVTGSAQAASPEVPDSPAAQGERLRIGDGAAGEVYAARRPSAPDDTRQWAVVRLGEVGLVVVGDDGKSEVLAVDKFGGVYINGDLYVKGKKVVEGAGQGAGSKWLLLALFVLSTLTSVGLTLGLSRRRQ